MVVDDRARHALYNELERVHGPEHAMTLMQSLPSSDVATKHDVAALASSIDGLDNRMDELVGRMDRLDGRMDRLEARLDRIEDRFDRLSEQVSAQARAFGYSAVGVAVATGSLVLAAAQLG